MGSHQGLSQSIIPTAFNFILCLQLIFSNSLKTATGGYLLLCLTMAKLKTSNDKLQFHLNISSLLSQKCHLRVEDFVWQSQCWDASDGLEQPGGFVKGIVFYKPLFSLRCDELLLILVNTLCCGL